MKRKNATDIWSLTKINHHFRGLECLPFTTGLLGMLAYELWMKLSTSKCSSNELSGFYIALVIVFCEFWALLFLIIYLQSNVEKRDRPKLRLLSFTFAALINTTIVSTAMILVYV